MVDFSFNLGGISRHMVPMSDVLALVTSFIKGCRLPGMPNAVITQTSKHLLLYPRIKGDHVHPAGRKGICNQSPVTIFMSHE